MSPQKTQKNARCRHSAKIARAAGVSLGWIMEEPGFTLTGGQRAKVRTAWVLLLNLTGCRSDGNAGLTGLTLKSGSETSTGCRVEM
jgi:hypothetical protein